MRRTSLPGSSAGFAGRFCCCRILCGRTFRGSDATAITISNWAHHRTTQNNEIVEQSAGRLTECLPSFFGRHGYINMWSRRICYRTWVSAALPAALMLNRQHKLDAGWARRLCSGSLLQFLTRENFYHNDAENMLFNGVRDDVMYRQSDHARDPNNGVASTVETFEDDERKVATAAIPGRKVALIAYLGWDAIDRRVQKDRNAEADESIVLYVREKSTKKTRRWNLW